MFGCDWLNLCHVPERYYLFSHTQVGISELLAVVLKKAVGTNRRVNQVLNSELSFE